MRINKFVMRKNTHTHTHTYIHMRLGRLKIYIIKSGTAEPAGKRRQNNCLENMYLLMRSTSVHGDKEEADCVIQLMIIVLGKGGELWGCEEGCAGVLGCVGAWVGGLSLLLG